MALASGIVMCKATTTITKTTPMPMLGAPCWAVLIPRWMWRSGVFAFAGAYIGKEKPKSKQASLQHLGNGIYGLRAGLQYNWRPDLGLFTSVQYENRQFDEQHPTFLQTRHDKQTSLHLGLNWSPSPHWRISPSLSWQNSHSNLPLFQVQRRTLAINARREF